MPGKNGGVVVVTAPPRTRFVQRVNVDPYSRLANLVTIRHPLGQIVAVIEIVSPGNKDSVHSLGTFVKKQPGSFARVSTF